MKDGVWCYMFLCAGHVCTFRGKIVELTVFLRTVCYVPLNAVIVFCVLFAVIEPPFTKRLRPVEPKIGYVFVEDQY